MWSPSTHLFSPAENLTPYVPHIGTLRVLFKLETDLGLNKALPSQLLTQGGLMEVSFCDFYFPISKDPFLYITEKKLILTQKWFA